MTINNGNPANAIHLPDVLQPLFGATWKGVCEWRLNDGDVAEPLEVNLVANWPNDTVVTGFLATPGFGVRGEIGFQSNGGLIFEPFLAAGWRVTYGGGGRQRVMVCDLCTQRLYLGVCDFVRIEALRWRQTTWPIVLPTLNLAAEVRSAQGGQYDEATATYANLFATAAPITLSNGSFSIPPQARYYAPMVTPNQGFTPNAFWGTASPDLYWQLPGTQVEYRIASRQITPNYPRYELMINSTLAGTGLVHSNGVNLAQALWVATRFYLQA